MFHVLEALQSDWEKVGITVDIKRSDWNVFKTSVREGKPDLYYLDWFADYPDGENFLYPLFHSKESMTKRNRFSDPEIDVIIEKIQQLTNSSRTATIDSNSE
jgi:peptide/nickel transport system substrate-binding protein/oligopeptide transport system substrate-binding protein